MTGPANALGTANDDATRTPQGLFVAGGWREASGGRELDGEDTAAGGPRVTVRLEVGTVGPTRGVLSSPAARFGGVKQSATGRDGEATEIAAHLSIKYASVRVSP